MCYFFRLLADLLNFELWEAFKDDDNVGVNLLDVLSFCELDMFVSCKIFQVFYFTIIFFYYKCIELV